MRIFVALVTLLILLAGSASAARRPRSKAAAAKKAASGAKKASVSRGKRAPSKARGRASRRRGRPVARGQAAPSPERIREIQEALSRSGHYRAQPTGKLDVQTAVALGSFQEAHGLERTGKLGAWTLRKLEQYGLPPNSPLTAAEQVTQ